MPPVVIIVTCNYYLSSQLIFLLLILRLALYLQRRFLLPCSLQFPVGLSGVFHVKDGHEQFARTFHRINSHVPYFVTAAFQACLTLAALQPHFINVALLYGSHYRIAKLPMPSRLGQREPDPSLP